MRDNPFRDSVRLQDSERNEMLNRLDNNGAAGSAKPRRSTPRMEYRAKDICVTMSHPGGTVGRFLVCARNISSGGMSFVHGGFAHTGTECRIVLFTADGQGTTVIGHVRTCRHITRNIHEIGIEFNEKIEPSLFCRAEAKRTSDDPSVSLMLPNLVGNALIITAESLERKVLTTRLRASGMNAVAVESLGAGLDQLKLLSYGIVLVELQTPNSTPTETVNSLAKAGYTGPIVGLAPTESIEHAAAARAAKMHGCVGKPFNAGTLLQLVNRLMKESGADLRSDKPIYSTIARDPGAQQLIDHYINQSRLHAALIQKAMEEQDISTISKTVQAIKGTAGGYGFAPLAEAAKQAIQALDASTEIGEARLQIETLLSVCSRLQPGLPTD